MKVDERDYEKVLQDLPHLVDGKINSYHEYLFQKIEKDSFSKWVLAVLAYRKENTSIEVIQEILKIVGENRSLIAIEDVVNEFAHLHAGTIFPTCMSWQNIERSSPSQH